VTRLFGLEYVIWVSLNLNYVSRCIKFNVI